MCVLGVCAKFAQIKRFWIEATEVKRKERCNIRGEKVGGTEENVLAEKMGKVREQEYTN